MDIHLYRQHALEDKKATYSKAQEDADATVEAQIQEITTHLSAHTLADNVSGPSREPGGSLWFRETGDIDPHTLSNNPPHPSVTPDQTQPNHQHPPSCPSPSPFPPTHSPPKKPGSNRLREQEIILSLSELESDVQKLFNEVQKGLAGLGRLSPGGPPHPFPLLSFFQMSGKFMLELDTITLKKPAVLAMKDSISRKLQQIDHTLQSAKRQ